MKIEKILISSLFIIITQPSLTVAQTVTKDSEVQLRKADAAYWQDFNKCDISGMEEYSTDDIEFYHDAIGITLGKVAFSTLMRQNICVAAEPDYKIRREVVPKSVQINFLYNNGNIYGAIYSGKHVFYKTDKTQPEHQDGRGRFTHLWLLKDNGWKLSRAFSYAHGK